MLWSLRDAIRKKISSKDSSVLKPGNCEEKPGMAPVLGNQKK